MLASIEGAKVATRIDPVTLEVIRNRLDVIAADAGERMLAATEERFGRLDVLVNNAGAAQWRDMDDVPEEDWRAQYELNVMAPLRAMRAAAPAMAERGWGRVVNVPSTAGKRPSAAMAEYSVTKAAELLQTQDRIIKSFPEVESVFGKAGRAVTATEPAPVEMFETVINLKPEVQWRPGVTTDKLIAEMADLWAFAFSRVGG